MTSAVQRQNRTSSKACVIRVTWSSPPILPPNAPSSQVSCLFGLTFGTNHNSSLDRPTSASLHRYSAPFMSANHPAQSDKSGASTSRSLVGSLGTLFVVSDLFARLRMSLMSRYTANELLYDRFATWFTRNNEFDLCSSFSCYKYSACVLLHHSTMTGIQTTSVPNQDVAVKRLWDAVVDLSNSVDGTYFTSTHWLKLPY